MTRICMVAYTRYPADVRVRREAEALIDRGDTVDLICLREDDSERVRIVNGVRSIQISLARYRGSSVSTYLISYLQFFLVASVLLARLHFRHRYQVIQVHTLPDFMVFVAIVPKLLGAKVILDVHDLMPELYRSKFGLSQSHWLVRLLKWIERASIGFADRAIAVHRLHLDALIEHGNPAGKFTILLNLPDPKIFTQRAQARDRRDGEFRLVYHGLISKRHGLDVALRAVYMLAREINGLRLHIYGDGDARSDLVALATELGLEESVQISQGYVPIEDLLPMLRESDLGIVPILYDDFTRYMLPVKLLEYVGLGIPVVCSRTETIEAYFDGTMVRYCRPGDPADLAAQILALYRDPVARMRLTENADRFNHEHNWERAKRDYYQMVDDLCQAPREKEALFNEQVRSRRSG